MERRREEDRSSSPFCLSRCNCKKRSPVTNFGANSYSLFSEQRQPGRRRGGGGGGEGGGGARRDAREIVSRGPKTREVAAGEVAEEDTMRVWNADIFILSKALFSLELSPSATFCTNNTRAHARARKKSNSRFERDDAPMFETQVADLLQRTAGEYIRVRFSSSSSSSSL